MENREDEPSNSPKPKDPPLCEECKTNPSKYKCPGCSVRSCSLPCVKSHKQRTGCTGKKNQTQFVPLSQFDDNLLFSDYSFLEEAKRVSESAQRLRSKLRAINSNFLPHFLKTLQNSAASRRTTLLFFPPGMSKREKNRTRYNYRGRLISWTIEWRFHSTDVVLHDHGVNENMNLRSIIENHLKPGPWNHPLRKYCVEDLDSLKCFIRKFPKGSRSPFRQLDMEAPIREQLSNLVILEYPVIYVFLPSHNISFEVVQDAKTVICKPDAENSVNCQIPEGIPYKEEVIGDTDDSPDPQVIEFKRLARSSPQCRIPSQSNGSGKAVNYKLDRSKVGADMPINSLHPKSESMECGGVKNMEFDFDQSLIDAYSDLIAQGNPDDFLDLGDEFLEGMNGEKMGDLSDLTGIFTDDEELEEGEIVE